MLSNTTAEDMYSEADKLHAQYCAGDSLESTNREKFRRLLELDGQLALFTEY